MRTIVCVDGFNLYHRLLKHDRSLRWLNIEALIRRMLFDNDELVAIKYYTAPVSKAIDEDAPRKQETYLNALRSTPIVSTYFGSFLASEKWAGLIHPPRFKPELSEELQPPHPSVVRIRKFEEKGSDVNLGVHLVEDAYLNNFDLAIIVSNDTGLPPV